MKLTIKQIATFLQVRPVRIREKVVQLNLLVDESDELSIEQVQTLVRSYKDSNRVGERTRQLAAELLNRLENKTFQNHEKPNKGNVKSLVKSCGWNKKKITAKPILKSISNFVNILISALLSNEFKFVALMVAIVVQMQHSAAWFHRLSSNNVQEGSWVTAYGYAFMVDLFILVITFEGRKHVAKTFAVLTFFANVLYFQFWVGYENNLQNLTNAVSCIMVSGIIAYIIYAYTEIFFQVKNN